MVNHRLEFSRKRNLNSSIRERRKRKEPIELIVKSEKKDALARELDRVGKVTRVFDSIPYVSFSCDSSDAYSISQAFHKLSDNRAYSAIVSAISVLDVSGRMAIAPVKKSRALGHWNLEEIGAYQAQQIASGSGVSVAVIDTGVNYLHPELRDNFGSDKGYDFVNGSFDPMDRNGHGTHVAGIAFGSSYGVAPDARAYSVRVLDENGEGAESDTIAGLDWAAKKKVDVINMSLGSPFASTALEEMCYYLANKGVLIAAAAGNDGFGPNYPAAFGAPVIAVAAVDRNKEHADFSNIYETNDISAPGVGITSSYLEGYATLSGTSMASPHAAGSLALALSAIKSECDLEDLMETTAERLEDGIFPEREVYGAGLIRVDSMVKAIAGSGISSESYGREILNVFREVLGV